MKIDLVEIYENVDAKPFENPYVIEVGSVHVELPDVGIEIKNIQYILRYKDKRKKKKIVYVRLPHRLHKNPDDETKRLHVVNVSFIDRDKQREFITRLRKLILKELK